MTQLSETMLKNCSEAFKGARQSVWSAAALLYEIKVNEAWRGHFESLGAYVEEECGISQSFASKLLAGYEHFAVKATLSDKLAGLDYEKAYLAIKLKGTPEQQLSKALTLTRRELKEERNDDEPHEHIWNSYCTICGIKHP